MPTEAEWRAITAAEAVKKCFASDSETIAPSDLEAALRSGLLSSAERKALVVKFLRTPAQRQALAAIDFTFDDLWEFQYKHSGIAVIENIYDEWNMRLGVICFRSRYGTIGDAYPADKVRPLAPWPYLINEQSAQPAVAPKPVTWGTPKTVIEVTSADVEALIDRHYGMNGADAIALAGWEDDHEYLIPVHGHLSPADVLFLDRFVQLGKGGMDVVRMCLNDLAGKGIIAKGNYLALVRYL